MNIFSNIDFNINSKVNLKLNFDAIVIGSGISGGWAAKELCDHGLNTLVLERGRDVVHNVNYPTANLNPWEVDHRNVITSQIKDENPIISLAAGYGEDTKHFFVKDKDHPYVQEKPFTWVRGYQVGGKSLIWGRACPRWSPNEFTSPGKLGYGMNWPIKYKDIAPWYSHVERFMGVCGNKDGLATMPDGVFQPPFEMNAVERNIKQKIQSKYGNRHYIQGRWAHITKPSQQQVKQGRGKCQSRNKCMRGCPFGGYFSSNSCTLPWAKKTGNLTIRPNSVVHSILYDEQKGKAIGVKVIDNITKEISDFFAKIIFVNASALNSTLVLMNSKSGRFPNGLGNDSGTLGKYVGFHNYSGTISADMPGYEDDYYFGSNPTECMVANFRNFGKQDTDFVGGYMAFSGAYRVNGEKTDESFGANFKAAQTKPGPWRSYMYMQGETILKASNHVYLSKTEKDQWGIPLLVTAVDYDENDVKMRKDFLVQGSEMLEAAGAQNIKGEDRKWAPGLDIHEMGGCRMGNDPRKSMLNKHNQLHACKNVFVTDGACMTSTGIQSPSIFYMALTARAVNYAVSELKKGNL